MFIWKLRETDPDGYKCDYMMVPDGTPIPEGYQEMSEDLAHAEIYFVDGKLTNEKPMDLVNKEYEDYYEEELISKRVRALAIRSLIDDGILPPDYKDKRMYSHAKGMFAK